MQYPDPDATGPLRETAIYVDPLGQHHLAKVVKQDGNSVEIYYHGRDGYVITITTERKFMHRNFLRYILRVNTYGLPPDWLEIIRDARVYQTKKIRVCESKMIKLRCKIKKAETRIWNGLPTPLVEDEQKSISRWQKEIGMFQRECGF